MQNFRKNLSAFARKQWLLLLLVAAELVFLGVRFSADYHAGHPVTLDRSWFVPYYGDTEYVDDGILFSGSDKTAESSQTFTFTEKFDLPKGSYRILINYRNVGCTTTFNFGSAGSTDVEGLSSDEVTLTPATTSAEALLTLNYDCTGDKALYMRFTAAAGSGEGTSSLIQSVQFIPSHRLAYANLFGVLALFALLDFALLVLRGVVPNPWAEPKKAAGALILTAIVLLACQPLGLTYLTTGHDLPVHLSRIDQLAQTLMQGQFPARIYPDVANGKGYPFGIMYPDLFLYPFAVLRILGFTLEFAYKAYILCVTAATALITRHCLRRMFRSEVVALTGTALYTLCYYRLTNIFVRAAAGEYTAMTFLPLVIYGLWCIYTQPKDAKKAAPWCWLPLALGFSGLLQSHLISTLMAAGLVALFCLVMLRRTFTRPVFVGLCKAAGCALLWNVWYLIPCLQYMRAKVCTISLAETDVWGFSKAGAFLTQLFAVSGSETGYSAAAMLGFEPDLPLTVGLVLGLAALLMLLALVCPDIRKKNPQLVLTGGLSLGFGFFALYLGCIEFPWLDLYTVLPGLVSTFETIQFPWRFLSLGSALLVVAGCCALRLLPDALALPDAAQSLTAAFVRLARMGLASVLIVLTVLPGAELMVSVCMSSPVLHYLSGAALTGERAQIANGEYLPAELELYDGATVPWDVTTPTLPLGVEMSDFSRGTLACTFTGHNTNDTNSTVRLPLYYYPGYSITAGDTAVSVTQGTGFVAAVLPAGWSGTFTVGWKPRFYWHLLDFISLAGVIATVVLYRRRKQDRQITTN